MNLLMFVKFCPFDEWLLKCLLSVWISHFSFLFAYPCYYLFGRWGMGLDFFKEEFMLDPVKKVSSFTNILIDKQNECPKNII